MGRKSRMALAAARESLEKRRLDGLGSGVVPCLACGAPTVHAVMLDGRSKRPGRYASCLRLRCQVEVAGDDFAFAHVPVEPGHA